MKDDMAPHEAAARATQHLGRALRVVGRYDLGGDEGAYRVHVAGAPYAFKHWSGERAAALRLGAAVAAHGVLQGCGWPLPAIHFWYSDQRFAFVVEAHMRGSRVDTVPEALCLRLLELLASVPPGVGGIPDDTDAWLASLEGSLYHDLPLSPCRPLALQRTVAGRRLVGRARNAFAAARPALAAARDVIHGDFSAGNILCDDTGALAAMLDWQRAGVGHRGFDLIGLEWDLALRRNDEAGSAASFARVTALADERIERSVRAFCRSYYAVWNLSWALDTPDEEEVLRTIEVVGDA
jgi:hypothetical protein